MQLKQSYGGEKLSDWGANKGKGKPSRSVQFYDFNIIDQVLTMLFPVEITCCLFNWLMDLWSMVMPIVNTQRCLCATCINGI